MFRDGALAHSSFDRRLTSPMSDKSDHLIERAAALLGTASLGTASLGTAGLAIAGTAV